MKNARGGVRRSQQWGYRMCRKCGIRRPYPSQFARTRTGTVSDVTCNRCGGKRQCQECGELRRVPDQIRPFGVTCAPCQIERRRAADRRRYREHADEVKARVREWQKRNPEKFRSYMRTAWENMRSDPERWNAYLVKQRIDRRVYGKGGTAQAPKASIEGWQEAPRGSHFGEQLDAAPLSAWLRHEFHGWGYTDVARQLGEDDRQMRRLLLGEQRYISLHVADRICVKADCTHMLAVLYPMEQAA